jgi:chaperonin GroES
MRPDKQRGFTPFVMSQHLSLMPYPCYSFLQKVVWRQVLVNLGCQRTPKACGANGSEKGGILMKVRPLHDRLIVKRLEEEEKTKGGIIIPDTAKETPVEGKVIAVGKGKIKKDGTKIPMEVKKGDRILFAKYAGTEVKIDGEEHLIMKEDDVLAIIEQ